MVLMKQTLLNNIIEDITRLQELTLTDIDDTKNCSELLILLHKIKELVVDFEDIDELVKMYNNLKLPIKMLLTSIDK